MKHFYASALALFASGCLPIGQPDQIVVDGEAALEFQPEIFSIKATIRARKEDQADALADISQRISKIRESLPQLEGLTEITIDASAAEISPIQDAECMERAQYRLAERCAVTGYYGALNISVAGAPAKASGQAMSLLSELGAESVVLEGYSLKDRKAAEEDALDAAMKDARHRAEKIAAAAGAAISGPLRIQYGQGFPGDEYRGPYL